MSCVKLPVVAQWTGCNCSQFCAPAAWQFAAYYVRSLESDITVHKNVAQMKLTPNRHKVLLLAVEDN